MWRSIMHLLGLLSAFAIIFVLIGGIFVYFLEAAAFGLPVVATTLLSGQLGWTSGEQLWSIEPESSRFSEAVISAYKDKNEWERIRQSAINTVEHDLSRGAFIEKLANALGVES